MRTYLIAILMAITAGIYAQNGIVKGRVVDAETNEPVPFANVVVAGTLNGTAASAEGEFVLANIPTGYIRLSATAVGYTTAFSSDVLVTNKRPQTVEIRLTASSKELDEVTVKASPFKKEIETPVALQKIGIEEIENSPGSNRDISRVIQSFPGVGGTPAFRNDIIIRGGGPSEINFYLDEVEIPTINHFATQGASGGPVGILNADLLSDVNFYSGAFPASTGDALSGVFKFSQKDGNPDKIKTRAAVGASETSLSLDGPMGKKTTYIVSARRSYLQFLFAALELPFLPTFTDYQMKVKHKISPKSEISFISIGALDDFSLNTGIKDPDEQQEYILTFLPEIQQWSYATGAVYKHYLPAMTLTAVASRNALNNVIFKYPENDRSQPKTQDYESDESENKLRIELQTKRIGAYRYSFGGSYEFAQYVTVSDQLVLINTQPVRIQDNTTLDLHKYAVFGQISRKFMESRLTMTLGARTDANSFGPTMNNPIDQLSLRASANYMLTERISLSASTGKYYQLPAYTSMGYRTDGQLANSTLKYIGAMHYVAGISYTPEQNSLLSVEGFYKQYSHYPYSVNTGQSLASGGADYGIYGQEVLTSTAEGSAYGAELLYRMRTEGGRTVTAAYTYVVSTATGNSGANVPTTWDSRHLLTVTGVQKFGKNWSAGGKFRFVGGLPYTPYDLSASSRPEVWQTAGGPVRDYSRFNGERFNAFHQLDVRVDKQFFFKKWSLMVYLDIQNLYNFQSPSTDIVLREKNLDGTFALDENGNYRLRSIKNTSGTVLPTIGIMVEF